MVRSMTGYGRVMQTIDGYSILFEIKSVNHRFFDFTARVPRLYGYLDDKLKGYLQRFISRGKVEVFVTVEPLEGQQADIRLNRHLAESYISALKSLRDTYSLKDDISVSAVARFSDIFTVLKNPEDEKRVWGAVRKAADMALEGFNTMRDAEGARLCGDMETHLARVAQDVEQVENRSPQTVAEYRARLYERMKEVLRDEKFDENRILMEAAVYADKVAVDEETVRLKSHLSQFGEMLRSAEPVGRKLDFLMQEMNREANTIGSKAMDVEIARLVVDMKAELEKIREQVQNVE